MLFRGDLCPGRLTCGVRIEVRLSRPGRLHRRGSASGAENGRTTARTGSIEESSLPQQLRPATVPKLLFLFLTPKYHVIERIFPF